MNVKTIPIMALITVIVGAVLFAAAGCGNTTGTSTYPPQPASTGQVQPSDNGTMPMPPKGFTPGDRPGGPSDNGTMPGPPGGFEPGQGPAMSDIDWAAIADELGVTEEQLREAVGDFSSGMPDLAAAAATLGVTEEALREALGFMGGGPPGQGGPPPDGAMPDGQGPPGATR